MTPPPAPANPNPVSPDGQWRWDGQAWIPNRPATPDPRAFPGPQTFPPGTNLRGTNLPGTNSPGVPGQTTPIQGALPPGAATRARGTAGRRLLAAAAGLVAGGLIGVAGGFIAGHSAATGGGQAGAGTKLAVLNPFPGDARYLPGLTASYITGRVTKAGFGCDSPVPPSVPLAKARVTCNDNRPQGSSFGAFVALEYDDEAHVVAVEASCRPSVYNTKACDAFFTSLTDIAFQGDPGHRQPAKDWTLKNSRRDSAATFGAIDLVISLDGRIQATATG